MTTKTTKTVSLADASAQLAELIRLTRQGTEVIITDAGMPLVRLVPADGPDQPRIAGLNEGEVWMSDDFDAEMPELYEVLGEERALPPSMPIPVTPARARVATVAVPDRGFPLAFERRLC
jgi:prevent-host-death family protein